jgi:hypothetical protein
MVDELNAGLCLHAIRVFQSHGRSHFVKVCARENPTKRGIKFLKEQVDRCRRLAKDDAIHRERLFKLAEEYDEHAAAPSLFTPRLDGHPAQHCGAKSDIAETCARVPAEAFR